MFGRIRLAMPSASATPLSAIALITRTWNRSNAMAPEKLIIKTEKGREISAQFNPEKFTTSRSVQYAEIAIPGLDAPLVQFVRGQSEKVTLELFFDTTEKGTTDTATDVRDYTEQVYA